MAKLGESIFSLAAALLILASGSGCVGKSAHQAAPEPAIAPEPLYVYTQSWVADRNTEAKTHSFRVPDNATEFTFDHYVQRFPRPEQTGCLEIILLDPAGEVEFASANPCGDDAGKLSLSGAGDWTVRYVFLGFEGIVDVRAYPEST